MNPSQLLSQLKKINLNKIYRDEVEKLEPEILDANIEQLSRGEGFDGSNFDTYMYDDYFKAKKAEGLTENAGRKYNFRLSGNFRKGFYGDFINQTDFKVSSKDSKTGKLQKLADNKIFGLQPKSKQIIKTQLLPNMREQYRKELGL